MKTSSYNPSPLEIAFATALESLQTEIESYLQGNKITQIEAQVKKDNPMVKFNLVDNEGDPHEVVLRIIQIPDKF